MLAKSSHVELDRKQVPGWADFQEGIKTRNRIVHPRSVEDVVVTEADYQTAVKAFQWVVRCNLGHAEERTFDHSLGRSRLLKPNLLLASVTSTDVITSH